MNFSSLYNYLLCQNIVFSTIQKVPAANISPQLFDHYSDVYNIRYTWSVIELHIQEIL